MTSIGIIIFLIGIMGFVWTLFGSMFISIVYGLFNSPKKMLVGNENKKVSFEILLAAYNEEKTIKASLDSYIQAAKNISSNIEMSVTVGLDHCTDKTQTIIEELQKQSTLKINYIENDGQRGKWFVIKKLILNSQSDWVSLTDCGSIWNEKLMESVAPFLLKDDLICIAPSYLPEGAGILETIYWRMEQRIRLFENRGGGSIMVHGLTVFYRRQALLRALHLLGNKHWFNDDVAIPLTLRLDNPQNHILYFAHWAPIAWVRDIGVVSNISIEKNRRKRILIGNLQIIKEILFPQFKFNSMAAVTSLRLLFKSLWAYWVTCMFLGTMLMLLGNGKNIWELIVGQSPIWIAIELLGVAFILKSNYVHRLFMAYLSGMQIRRSWKDLEDTNKISWS